MPISTPLYSHPPPPHPPLCCHPICAILSTFMLRYRKVSPYPLNIDYNLLHIPPLLPADITVSVSDSKYYTVRVVAIVFVASAAAVSVGKLGHPNYPPLIFNNILPAYDSYGTDIFLLIILLGITDFNSNYISGNDRGGNIFTLLLP